MADSAVMVCTAGSLVGKRYPIPRDGSVRVGRADDNQVVLRDDGVSRFHAEVLDKEGTLWLQDAGSRNGVFVNGNRVVGHQTLKVGDRIAIALTEFELRWNEPDRATPSPVESAPRPRRWYWPFS